MADLISGSAKKCGPVLIELSRFTEIWEITPTRSEKINESYNNHQVPHIK
jgi:hypothetical protein